MKSNHVRPGQGIPRRIRPGPGLGMLVGVALAAIAFMWVLPPLPQPPAYHQMADRRDWLGIPNGLNVVSNVPLSVAGGAGLAWLAVSGNRRRAIGGLTRTARRACGLFFLGALLTGVGSAYYHWAPDHARLVWDRLPMTLCFMAFLTLGLHGRLGEQAARRALPMLVMLGPASVIYWHWSELLGSGDLRPYLFVQFISMLLIPLALWLLPARDAPVDDGDMLVVLGLYGLALACDRVLDAPLFALGGLVSGHTLKHLVAACAVFCLLGALRRRVKQGAG